MIAILHSYKEAGITSILALRGDPTGGPSAPWTPTPIPGVTDIDIDIPMAGSTTDLQRQRAQGGFTGSWQVMVGGEEVYRFSGVGNNQGDANRVASQWVQTQQNQGLLDLGDNTSIEVLPVMS